ncbi:MAG: TonB family protein [Sutterellaceae bacterium]|nr:TonB family protein [Sutterellaceae bacterium]
MSAVISLALAVNVGLAFLIWSLTGARVPGKVSIPVLATVYWPSPIPDYKPREEVEEMPTRSETVAPMPPPQPLTLDFKAPNALPSEVRLSQWQTKPVKNTSVFSVPQFSFEATQSAAPVTNVTSSVVAARPTLRTPPQYPPKARQQGIEGNVVMDLLIGTDGMVKEVKVVRETPPEIFRRSAIRAVHRWRFVPPDEQQWQRLTIRYELTQ